MLQSSGMIDLVIQIKKSLLNKSQQGLSSLCQMAGLRQRHVITRTGLPRLRYAIAGLALAGFAITILGGVSYTAPTTSLMASLDATETQNRPQAEAALQTAQTDNTAQASLRLALTKKPEAPQEKFFEIGKGDTLAGVLNKAGVPSTETYKAVEALKEFFDPRAVKPGQKIVIDFDSKNDGEEKGFSRLRMDIDPLRSVSLEKNRNGVIKAALHEREAKTRFYAQNASIENSLYGSALKNGIPSAVVAEAIRIYSWDVDFQRDLRKGDTVEVMYEQLETEDGQKIKTGNIVYARLSVNGNDIPVYRYEMKNGDIDYFTADGKSVRKTLMTTPVDGARLSSGYGMRHHPVLGYNKMHKGMDFAAPTGTPIYAAGDGTIEKMGKFGAYGNYVRIRHNSNIKTAYAHMQKFAKGLSAGSRIKQGQIIGYIGTTGRSTGPHLHYEVLKNDTQVNPRTIDLPQGESLKGVELASFKSYVRDINSRYESLLGGGRYAQMQASEKSSRVR